MDKKLTGLMSAFFLAFALFISLVFANSNFAGKARATNNSKPSTDTSFILAYPLELSNSSGTSSTVALFVRDLSTKPLQEKVVELKSSLGTLQPATVITDSDGKATAQFRCPTDSTAGVAQISAII